MDKISLACWVCGSTSIHDYKKSNLSAGLTPEDFQITDSNYGTTAALSRCGKCRFIQASDLPPVLAMYEKMKDPSYEFTRSQRALQAKKLLERLQLAPGCRLLDVGAGSGILVEEAIKAGISATGVEPSDWLFSQAVARGLSIHHGTLRTFRSPNQYDVVTLVDVIEHVSDPVALIKEARTFLKPGGQIFVVTPDVSSICARLLGLKWWHFRIAHIGYFDLNNLDLAFKAAGLARSQMYRPSWYFPVDYLFQRLSRYLPFLKWLPLPKLLSKVTVPLNLFDSLAVTYQARQLG